MSLRKGRIFRRVQPWTASNDWINNSRPGAYIKPFGVVYYSGFQVIFEIGPISEKYSFDRGNLEFKWFTQLNIPLLDFGCITQLRPHYVAPGNELDLLLTDFAGSTMQARWLLAPFSYEWSYPGFSLPTTPYAIHTTGSFDSLLYWGYACATYLEHP